MPGPTYPVQSLSVLKESLPSGVDVSELRKFPQLPHQDPAVHVVQIEGERVEVAEEGRPGVIECLCDECDTTLTFDEVEDVLRKEILLTLGAR